MISTKLSKDQIDLKKAVLNGLKTELNGTLRILGERRKFNGTNVSDGANLLSGTIVSYFVSKFSSRINSSKNCTEYSEIKVKSISFNQPKAIKLIQ